MGKNDVTLTNADIIEYNEEVLPALESLEPTYSLVSRVRKRNIKGGESVEIDIYVTGLGIPEDNKLVLIWSSPNVIDVSSPGVATHCIKQATKQLKGKPMIAPIAGSKYATKSELDPNGIMINLNKGYFLPVPKRKKPHMPQIVGERVHAGYHPLSISLKTLKKAKSSDYKIDLNLTYRYKNTVKQAANTVEFRITNWWDRHQWWIITSGSIIAFIVLMLTALNIFGLISG
jgi:hypothetical protein